MAEGGKKKKKQNKKNDRCCENAYRRKVWKDIFKMGARKRRRVGGKLKPSN